MTKKIVISALLTAGITSPNTYSNELDWELEKEKNGVQVFTRAVVDSSLKEFKGSIIIKANQSDLVSVLQGIDNYHLWMPDVVETKIIESTDIQHIHYVKLDMPWPVTDRDGVYQFSYRTDEKGSINVSVSALPKK